MNPQQFALYAMTSVGILFAIVAAHGMWRVSTSKAPKGKPVTFAVLAFALIGVGAYGPSFLGDYANFLKELTPLSGEKQDAAYEKLVDDMATGKMPKEYRDLAQTYMLAHPSKNLDAVIDQGLSKAKPEERPGLQRMKEGLQQRVDTATLAAKGAVANPTPEEGGAAKPPLHLLDNSSLLILSRRPEAELKTLKIDPATVKALMAARARAAPNLH